MRCRPTIPLLPAALIVLGAVATLTACRPSPPQAPEATPPVVRAYTQFAPGDTLELVRIRLGLDNYEVRYRSSMPEGLMGMVYFLDDGNLHIDAKKVGETWVLVSVPLLDPSSVPAAERVAEWDRGADPQNREGRSQK
jgi:hypothetical protein